MYFEELNKDINDNSQDGVNQNKRALLYPIFYVQLFLAMVALNYVFPLVTEKFSTGIAFTILIVAASIFFPFWILIPAFLKNSSKLHIFLIVIFICLSMTYLCFIFAVLTDAPLPNFFNDLNHLYDKWVLGIK